MMRVVSCLSGVLLLAAAPTIVHSRQQDGYELSGQVRNVCGAWAPGTRVTLTNEAGVTLETHVNEPAGYRFSRVPGPGPWRLTADLLGFERLTVDQVSLSQTRTIVHLRLLRDARQVRIVEAIESHSSTRLIPYEVIGTVTAGGAPVDGPIVTIRHASKDGVIERCEGDERGRYTFFVYDRGPWRLTVEAPGLPTYTRDLLLQPRQRLTVDIPLK